MRRRCGSRTGTRARRATASSTTGRSCRSPPRSRAESVARPALEAIVLCLTDDGIRHLSPHGRETVRAGWEPALDPTESIVDAIAALGLAPTMAHSTSWRIADRQLLLTFLVVVEAPGDLP